MDHLHRPLPLPLHLRLQTLHRLLTPGQPPHIMGRPIAQLQNTDDINGTMPHLGTIPHQPTEAAIPLIVKVALETIIGKVSPDTTIPHAIPTDPAGDQYINEEHL